MMLSTHFTAMKVVRFLSRSFSTTVIQLKSKDLLSLSIEAGSQLTLETRNIDQLRSTLGSSSRSEEYSELEKISMTIRFQIIQTTTNGTTLPLRTLVFSGISLTGMRPNITTSMLLISKMALTISKLNLVSRQSPKTNSLRITTNGDGTSHLTVPSRRASELQVLELLPLLTSLCETHTSI